MTLRYARRSGATGLLFVLSIGCGFFSGSSEARSPSELVVVAQAESNFAGTYEGRIARRIIGGEARETRLYRVTINPDMNTGKVLVLEYDGKVRNELGFVARKTQGLTYEGQTQPINATPNYRPDNIRMIFAPDGTYIDWYHTDGNTEGSGRLSR